jgi:hypothetical protein
LHTLPSYSALDLSSVLSTLQPNRISECLEEVVVKDEDAMVRLLPCLDRTPSKQPSRTLGDTVLHVVKAHLPSVCDTIQATFKNPWGYSPACCQGVSSLRLSILPSLSLSCFSNLPFAQDIIAPVARHSSDKEESKYSGMKRLKDA